MMGLGFAEMMMMLLLPLGLGNDLFDCMPTKLYWEAHKVQVSVETMLAELRPPREAEDITPFIEKMKSKQFRVREEGSIAIRKMGAAAIPQLEKVAKSKQPAEVLFRVRALLKDANRLKFTCGKRRLMAIRTLGELKDRKALPVLKNLLTSKKPFEAEYAKWATAKIEGKAIVRYTRPSQKELDEDLWVLPHDCNVVLQLAPTQRVPYDLGKIFDSLSSMFGVMINAADEDPQEAARQMRKRAVHQVNLLIDQLGNIRVNALTLGFSADMNNGTGYVAVIFRGKYDRAAIVMFLRNKGCMVSEKDGVFTVSLGMGMGTVILESDHRVILVGGPTSHNALAAIQSKDKKKHLSSNREMASLVRSVDRTQAFWLAVKMSKAYKKGNPVLAAIDTFTLVLQQKGKGVIGTAVIKGTSEAALKRVVKEFDQGLQQAIKEIERAEVVPAPMRKNIETYRTLFKSIQRHRKGNKMTITGEIKDITTLPLMSPMWLMMAF